MPGTRGRAQRHQNANLPARHGQSWVWSALLNPRLEDQVIKGEMQRVASRPHVTRGMFRMGSQRLGSHDKLPSAIGLEQFVELLPNRSGRSPSRSALPADLGFIEARDATCCEQATLVSSRYAMCCEPTTRVRRFCKHKRPDVCQAVRESPPDDEILLPSRRLLCAVTDDQAGPRYLGCHLAT
jgi:hypothetical protein